MPGKKIRAWFNHLNREQNIKEGKRLLNEKLQKIGKVQLDSKYSILKKYMGRDLTLNQRQAVLEEIGRGEKLVSDVVRKVFPHEKIYDFEKEFTFDSEEKLNSDVALISDKNELLESQVLVGEESGLPVKIAACCSPGLKDHIIAYVTRGSRVTIHRSNCRMLDTLSPERFVSASWKGAKSAANVTEMGVVLKVRTSTKVGLMSDITRVISSFGLNILDVKMKRIGTVIYDKYFLLDLDEDQKDDLKAKLMEVVGVMSVSFQKDFS